MSEELVFPSAPKVQNNAPVTNVEKYTPPRPPVLSNYTILQYDTNTGDLTLDNNNAYSRVRVRNGSGSVGGGIQKNRTIAIILAILWGIFGAHLFYLGYTKKAVKRLFLFMISAVLSAIVIGVIGIVICIALVISDIIKIYKDQPLEQDNGSKKA